MIDLFKSFFIKLDPKQKLVDRLLEIARREHIYVWYRRQVIDYAERHKANLNTPFSSYKQNGLAYRNKTTSSQERLIFLE